MTASPPDGSALRSGRTRREREARNPSDPMIGSGMQQARRRRAAVATRLGGASRRGGEEPRGRNVSRWRESSDRRSGRGRSNPDVGVAGSGHRCGETMEGNEHRESREAGAHATSRRQRRRWGAKRSGTRRARGRRGTRSRRRRLPVELRLRGWSATSGNPRRSRSATIEGHGGVGKVQRPDTDGCVMGERAHRCPTQPRSPLPTPCVLSRSTHLRVCRAGNRRRLNL